jgi:hypothetical protein
MPGTTPQLDYVPLTVAGQQRRTLVREMHQSPDYAIGPNRNSSVRSWYAKVPRGGHGDPGTREFWQISNDFCGFQRGRAIDPLMSPYGWISRTIPADHPSMPGFLYAEDIAPAQGKVSMGQDNAGVGTFDEWSIAVNYTSRMYDIQTDDYVTQHWGAANGGILGYPSEVSLLRYVSFTLDTAGYYQTYPNFGYLKWFSDGKPATIKRGILLTEADLIVVWHAIPWRMVPWTNIKSLIGRTNQADFGDIYGAGEVFALGQQIESDVPSIVPHFEPGTMVMLVPKFRMYKLLPRVNDAQTGFFFADMMYRFKIYQNVDRGNVPRGANSFYRWDKPVNPAVPNGPRRGDFELCVFGSNDRLFPSGDYSLLFTPLAPPGSLP